ncbi:MAG: RNA polymerase sigma factor [Phototrophicaceae bacterium]
MTVTRTNEQWLHELNGPADTQAAAIADLRQHVRRSILYYLSQDRSDLRHLSSQELERMADDLAQDTTLRIMDKIENFRGESQFTTWASRIAVRMTISDLRRARYRDFSLDDLTANGELPAASDNSQTPPGPEIVVEQSDVLVTIERALRDALTERQYQALVAVALRGVPMDLVAEQMGTNRNALYKLLHDARRKLRQHLESQGMSVDYMLNLFEK